MPRLLDLLFGHDQAEGSSCDLEQSLQDTLEREVGARDFIVDVEPSSTEMLTHERHVPWLEFADAERRGVLTQLQQIAFPVRPRAGGQLHYEVEGSSAVLGHVIFEAVVREISIPEQHSQSPPKLQQLLDDVYIRELSTTASIDVGRL